jgi:hypothetical protein
LFAEVFLIEIGLSEDWQAFARSLLLTLPLQSLMGRDKFDAEFERCKEYFLRGITGEDREDEKDDAEQRVRWLDEEYSSFWGAADKNGKIVCSICDFEL